MPTKRPLPKDLPFRLALRAAISQSDKHRNEIAAAVGVNDRTLQRWLIGDVSPPTDQWTKALQLCNMSPAACLLVAEYGRADLVGTPAYAYIASLLSQVFTQLAKIEEDGELSLDPRGACRDALMIGESWRTDYRRRQKFMDDEFERSIRAR